MFFGADIDMTEVAGKACGEVIAEFLLQGATRLKLSDVTDTVQRHPTGPEALDGARRSNYPS